MITVVSEMHARGQDLVILTLRILWFYLVHFKNTSKMDTAMIWVLML